MSQQQQGERNTASLLSLPRNVTATGLTELLAFSPDTLIVIDQSGTIIQANEQAASLFGYALSDLQGKLLEQLLPERLRSMHVAHRKHYFTTPRTRAMGAGLDLYGRCQDGREFPVDISLRPVLLDDTLLTLAAVRDMSEQRRIERERLQQAERLRLQAQLIDLSHDAILVRSPTNRVIFWNRGARELYGWTQEETLGRITHHLLQTSISAGLTQIDEELERTGSWEGELVHTCRDGRVVVVESRQALMHDEHNHPMAILEINRDITPRRHLEQIAETAHAQTEARLSILQQILDALPSSVYLVYGPEARLLLANRAAESVWRAHWRVDQPMREFLNTHGISVFTAQGRPLPLESFATLRAVRDRETVLHHQETIRHSDGTRMPVLVNAVALEMPVRWASLQGKAFVPPTQDADVASPQPVALVVHQDVSALKEAETLKDEFIGVAAHELRNPLGALKGFADMLLYQTAHGRGTELASWQREAIEEIEQATTRLDKLTEDLLDVTRLQAGRLVLSRKPTDLVGLVRHLVTQTQMTTQQHTISFETPYNTLFIEIDRTRIEQVLDNLLGNAVKY
nr:PAS domain S-box protein [Ktedonobacteraceae bacterium]